MINLSVLAAVKDWLPYPWLQIPGLIIVIVLVIGWLMYRRKNM